MPTKALIFSAPSGSGKTTIVKHLLKTDTRLCFSVSATTRNPRGEEQDGIDYYFLSQSEFEQKIAEDAFFEWEEVYNGTKYGTLISSVEEIWERGEIVVFDVDVVGGVNLKKKLGDKALSVFVKAPDIETVEDRLRKRNTDDEESLKKRLDKYREEMDYESHFDVVIINDDLERAKMDTSEVVNQFLEK